MRKLIQPHGISDLFLEVFVDMRNRRGKQILIAYVYLPRQVS